MRWVHRDRPRAPQWADQNHEKANQSNVKSVSASSGDNSEYPRKNADPLPPFDSTAQLVAQKAVPWLHKLRMSGGVKRKKTAAPRCTPVESAIAGRTGQDWPPGG